MPGVAETTHNLVPVCETFIEDCETPVSAFLKLRGSGPAFLLESAEQGQRVGRWSFIGYKPRKVLRWTLADGGDPYALAAAEIAPLPPGADRRADPVHGRRRRLLRLRLRARGRAPAGRQPRPRRAAGHGAHAVRRHRRLRPPQAHGDDPRQRVRRRGRGRARAGARGDPRGPRAARGPAAARRRRAAGGTAVRVQHAARGVRGDGGPDRRVRARRRRVPGRPLAALVGAHPGRAALDLPRPARRQPVALHVLPRLRGLPDRRRLARSRC